jgi:hypothetical protein
MLALARSGQIIDANSIAGTYLASEVTDNELLIEVARAYSQCSRFAANDADTKELLMKSRETVALATKNGFSDHVFLTHELDFVPLRIAFPETR